MLRSVWLVALPAGPVLAHSARWLPFLLECISGSRLPPLFLVELGAAIKVVSTTLPPLSRRLRLLSKSLKVAGMAFMTWTQTHGIKHILIEPGCPTRNADIESFNGTFRDECLDESCFESLEQARQIIATWRIDYNETRPHSSCGRIPPATFTLNRQFNWRFKA